MKQHTIECFTRDRLQDFFAPWNTRLVEMMKRDQAAVRPLNKRAPEEEPPFYGFDEMPCVDRTPEKDKLHLLEALGKKKELLKETLSAKERKR